jgi:ribosomal protein S26
MKMYYLESRSRGISYMKYVNGRRTELVTFCVETAIYNELLKERYKGDRSNRKTRKKT